MIILQRYILRELVTYFLFAFAAILGVFLVGATFQAFREGLGLAFLGKTLPMALGAMASWAVLVASCTSTTLVYGRMAAENEIDAMRMSGIHVGRVLAPALLFGVVLSGATYLLLEHVSPWAHLSRRRVVRESIRMLLKLPPPGPQKFQIGNYRLSYTDYLNGRMSRPFLMQFERGRLKRECHAVSGFAVVEEGKPPQVVMSRPTITLYHPDGKVDQMTAENDISTPLDMEDMSFFSRRSPDMSAAELLEYAERVQEPRRRADALTIYHVRHAQSLAPLLLMLVALPIGIFVKRASPMAGLGAALPPLLGYFVLFFICQGLGEKGRLPPEAAAYGPDAVLFVLSAILLWRVFRK